MSKLTNDKLVETADLCERLTRFCDAALTSPALRCDPMLIVGHERLNKSDIREAADHIARLTSDLSELEAAEARYRYAHDILGSGDTKTGRAWDLLKRAGDKARATLEAATREVRMGDDLQLIRRVSLELARFKPWGGESYDDFACRLISMVREANPDTRASLEAKTNTEMRGGAK